MPVKLVISVDGSAAQKTEVRPTVTSTFQNKVGSWNQRLETQLYKNINTAATATNTH